MKFRDVAHFYMGCKINTSLNGTVMDAGWYSKIINDECDAKPLLLSLEDMTEEDKRKLRDLTSFGDWVEKAKKVHYLTSKHYDVFDLISSGEAIRKTV